MRKCTLQAVSLGIQQVVVPDYRIGFFKALVAERFASFVLVAGDKDFGGSPVTAKAARVLIVPVRNRYFFGGRILWQKGLLKRLWNVDIAVLSANLRNLSVCILILCRRLRGKKTLIWGHAQGSAGNAMNIPRWIFFRLSHGFIAYTKSQSELLSRRYLWLKTWVAANSCVAADDCVPAPGNRIPDAFLYVGRLVATKKVVLLVEGFRLARERQLFNQATRLVIVGEGEERSLLESKIAEWGLEGVVEFVGHVSDLATLRNFYGRAISSVSPGYVGLSATQSFSFGVPMLIARDEFHSPEIEACQDGFNSSYFDSDNPLALAVALGKAYEKRYYWFERRSEIASWTRSNYSFEAMRKGFVKAAEDVLK